MQTGESNTGGSNNSFFGRESGKVNTSGRENSFFGNLSGNSNIDGIGNSFVGLQSGSVNTSGSYNVAIGYQSGPGFGSVNVDSTLYIDVQRTNLPLIYGQFNKRIVRINGEFEVAGPVFGGSSIHLKQNINRVTPQEILDQVVKIPISTWSYKTKSNVQHIGPMAQDFYAAFGLGKVENYDSYGRCRWGSASVYTGFI